jgi:hypothetical protein
MSPPFFPYRATFSEAIKLLEYVVAAGNQTWFIKKLRKHKRVKATDLAVTWESG